MTSKTSTIPTPMSVSTSEACISSVQLVRDKKLTLPNRDNDEGVLWNTIVEAGTRPQPGHITIRTATDETLFVIESGCPSVDGTTCNFTYYNPCLFSLSTSIIVSIRMVVVPAFPALVLDAAGERMTNLPLFSLTHLADDISLPTSISKPYATAQPTRNAQIDRSGCPGHAVII
jgi:hypothetical protein